MTLADLSPDRWTVIGTSGLNRTGLRAWSYALDSHNVSAMFLAREAGHLLTAQTKLADDRYELRARLVRR